MTRLPRISIHGNPAPQGSIVCKARHISYDGTRPGHQNLQPDNEKALKQWRKAVANGGHALIKHLAAQVTLPVTPFSGAVLVIATHTLARPRTVPLSARTWPSTKSPGHGDVDKLARALLDGLADAGIYTNDAQVCGLHVWKRYPDTPACEWIDPRDHLTVPGVVWRLHQLEQPPDELPFDAGPAGSPGEGPASAPEDNPSTPTGPAPYLEPGQCPALNEFDSQCKFDPGHKGDHLFGKLPSIPNPQPCPNISNGQFCRYYDGHLARGVPHTYGGGLQDPVSNRRCDQPDGHESHAWTVNEKDWFNCAGTPLELRYEQLADDERIG